MIESKKDGKRQETIQSSTTPDPGYGRTASAGPLFWTSMLSAVSLFTHFGSFFFVLTSDFQFIDAIINNACCACHP